MKLVTIQLSDQTHEKLQSYRATYLAERSLAAEEYARNGNHDLAKPLLEEISLEEMIFMILTDYVDKIEKNRARK